jgi:hypothetical protein
MFNISPAIPKENRPTNRNNELDINVKAGKIKIYSTIASRQMILELYRAINQPARGRDTMDPMGNPMRILPNSASDKDKNSLKSGIRVAQEAKFNPHNKNKTLIASLA